MRYIHTVIVWALIWPFVKKIQGLENIPRNGGFILAMNHQSYVDGLVMFSILKLKFKRYVHFIAKKELYKNRFLRYFYHNFLKCIKVNGTVEKAVKLLKKGKVLGIFPEGGIAGDGKVHEARKGVAVIAHESKVPIIPVGLKTYDFLPHARKIPTFKRCIEVRVGAPMVLEEFNTKKLTDGSFRTITNNVMIEIQRLLDE